MTNHPDDESGAGKRVVPLGSPATQAVCMPQLVRNPDVLNYEFQPRRRKSNKRSNPIPQAMMSVWTVS
jgi:hypothetical protein